MLGAQSCPTLCNPVDCSPPGSSVHGIFRQEYWSGLPFPSPGDLPDPGIEPATPASPALQAASSPRSHQGDAFDLLDYQNDHILQPSEVRLQAPCCESLKVHGPMEQSHWWILGTLGSKQGPLGTLNLGLPSPLPTGHLPCPGQINQSVTADVR